MIEEGQKFSSQEYEGWLKEQSQIITSFDNWMRDQYDFLITLATAQEAPEGLEYSDKPDSTLIWTFVGAPTLVVPKFKAPNGLPYGVQIIGRKYSDHQLISFIKLLKEFNLIHDASVVDF